MTTLIALLDDTRNGSTEEASQGTGEHILRYLITTSAPYPSLVEKLTILKDNIQKEGGMCMPLTYLEAAQLYSAVCFHLSGISQMVHQNFEPCLRAPNPTEADIMQATNRISHSMVRWLGHTAGMLSQFFQTEHLGWKFELHLLSKRDADEIRGRCNLSNKHNR